MTFQSAKLIQNWSEQIAVGPKGNPFNPLDNIDIYFFGMRRSGNHAVIKWLLGQFDHLNPDDNLRKKGVFYNDYGQLVPLDHRKDKVRLVSYENSPRLLDRSHRDLLLRTETGLIKHCFVVLRHPLNWYASYKALVNKNKWEKFGPNSYLVDMMTEYFETFYPESKDYRVCPILFDKWFKDPAYRKKIASTIVDVPNDRGFGSMDAYSIPSSFEGWTHKHSATELGVLERWKSIQEEELKELLKNERIVRIIKLLEGF